MQSWFSFQKVEPVMLLCPSVAMMMSRLSGSLIMSDLPWTQPQSLAWSSGLPVSCTPPSDPAPMLKLQGTRVIYIFWSYYDNSKIISQQADHVWQSDIDRGWNDRVWTDWGTWWQLWWWKRWSDLQLELVPHHVWPRDTLCHDDSDQLVQSWHWTRHWDHFCQHGSCLGQGHFILALLWHLHVDPDCPCGLARQGFLSLTKSKLWRIGSSFKESDLLLLKNTHKIHPSKQHCLIRP